VYVCGLMSGTGSIFGQQQPQQSGALSTGPFSFGAAAAKGPSFGAAAATTTTGNNLLIYIIFIASNAVQIRSDLSSWIQYISMLCVSSASDNGDSFGFFLN